MSQSNALRQMLYDQFGIELLPDGSLPPDTPCPICDDLGWYLLQRDGSTEKVQRHCPVCEAGRLQQQQVVEHHFSASGLPQRYQRLTFETWDKELADWQKAGKWEAFGAAQCFTLKRPFTLSDVYHLIGQPAPALEDDPPRHSIVFYGPYGVGKTGLAAAIVNALLGRELVLYMRVQELIKTIQDTYRKPTMGEPRTAKYASRKELIERLQTVPVLLLDEFGLQIISADRQEILEDVIRHRCGHDKPFIVTTNDSIERFRSRWEGRIVEVMLEAAHWIPVGGEQLRRQVQLKPRRGGAVESR